MDAVGHRHIDCVREIRGVAAGPQVAGSQPARFIGRNPGAGRDAFDLAKQGAENRSTNAVACGRCCRMCAMTVGISRGNKFSAVDRAGRLCAVDKVTSSDYFVVARRFFEALAGLTHTAPVLRGIKQEYVFLFFVNVAEPLTEQSIFGP